MGIRGRIDMDEYVAAVLVQQPRSLIAAGIVVRIDTAHLAVLTFHGDNGNLKLGQFLRGDGVAEDQHSLDLIGHQLLNVPPLTLLIPVPHEHQKLIAVGLISGEDLIEDLREEPVVKLRQDNADKLRLAVGQNAGHLVLFVVQLGQRLGNNPLALRCQGIRVVEIPGDGCLGKIGVPCDVIEGNLLFGFHSSAPVPPAFSAPGMFSPLYQKGRNCTTTRASPVLVKCV